MSRREITFFGASSFGLLRAIDEIAFRDRTGFRELIREGDVTVSTNQEGNDVVTQYSIKLADIEDNIGENASYYGRSFKVRALERLQRNLRQLSAAVDAQGFRRFSTMFIDMDPLPWIRDVKTTNDYLKSVDASGQVVEITPVYNYYAGTYQNAIATPFIDERLLPSIYDNEICRILQERDNDSYLGSPLSLQNARSKCGDLLPQTPEDWQDFGAQLAENPANQNMSANITLFPQTEIREILDLHKKKNLYPMYVDITFPTAPVGPFMQALQKAKLSTTLFDEVARAITQGLGTQYTVVGKSNTLFQVDEESIENRRIDINDRNPSRYEQGIAVEGLNFTNIINNIVDAARAGNNDQAVAADFLTLRGSERNPSAPRGSCLSLLDRVYMKAVTDRIESIIERSEIPKLLDRMNFNNAINQWRILSPEAQELREEFGQEVIAYSIEKSNQRMGLLSTHIFPNSADLGVLKYVDTQVKYDEEYQYEVFAHVLTTSERGRIAYSVDNRGVHNITTRSTKGLTIAKVPIASTDLTGPNIGGAFPTIKILDRPPIAPNFTFIPYKGVKNKMLIKLERQTDELTGQRTVPYVPILSGDTERFEERATYQRIENFDLPQGHVEFKAEGEDTVAVQVFRTTEEPEHTVNPEESTVTNEKLSAFRNFSDNLYREVTAEEGLAFTDTLTPNVKYYYTFRSVDINGNFSNPTAIMQVEIVETEGVTYPLIKEYIPQRQEPDKQDARTMTRFLQIRPSYLMSEPLPNENEILTVGDQLGDTTFGKHYKIRITSLDTGRQFDVNCKFDKVVLTEEE